MRLRQSVREVDEAAKVGSVAPRASGLGRRKGNRILQPATAGQTALVPPKPFPPAPNLPADLRRARSDAPYLVTHF